MVVPVHADGDLVSKKVADIFFNPRPPKGVVTTPI